MREGSSTLEQIPVVSFAFTSPANRSFPTGSNTLLAMFSSPAPGGCEYRMISAARALHFSLASPSALSFSWIPSGTSLSFITMGQQLCKPKQVGFIQEGNLLLVLRVTCLPPHPFLSPLPLHHNRPSFTQFLSFSTLKKKKFFLEEQRRCLCEFELEAVYLWPGTGLCVCGVTTSVLFDCIVS